MYMVSRADWQNAMKGAEVRFATGHRVPLTACGLAARG